MLVSTVSGLNHAQSAIARELVVAGAMDLLRKPAALHYTEDGQRWQGIDHGLDFRKGKLITEGDCSSTGTWLYWVALHLRFGLGDIVNGAKWLEGFTGTMSKHGRRVDHQDNQLHADAVLYGTGYPYKHTAVLLGKVKGKRMVFSHGSEGGPYLLPIDYRSDVGPIIRYI